MTISETITVAPNATNVLTQTNITNAGAGRAQTALVEVITPGATINYAYMPNLPNGVSTNPPISLTASYYLSFGVPHTFRDYDNLVNLVFQNNSGTPIDLFVTYGSPI